MHPKSDYIVLGVFCGAPVRKLFFARAFSPHKKTREIRSAVASASLQPPRHIVCFAKSHIVCFAKIIRSAVASASRQPPRCIVCFAKIITAYQRTAVITSLQGIKTTLQYLYNRHASPACPSAYSCAGACYATAP